MKSSPIGGVGKMKKLRSRPRGRSQRVRRQHSRYLILTNGQVTELCYFDRINQLTQDSLVVKHQNGDVKKLVEKAITMKKTGDFDKAFVVCDIDDGLDLPGKRKRLREAEILAKKNGIILILSQESFEVWLLCHVMKKVPGRARHRSDAQDLAVKHGICVGTNQKSIIPTAITKESIATAAMEAKRLREVHGEDGPFTDMDILVDSIGIC